MILKNKVFIVPQILEQTREERTTNKGGNLIYSICKIKYIFYAEDGTYIEAVTVGEGMDSGDKATNKAMAIAMKYALFQVFCIPTEEMKDPDGETTERSKPKNQLISAEDAKRLQEIMENKGLNVQALLQKNYNLNNTTELNSEQYAKIMIAIKDIPNKIEGGNNNE